MNYFNGSQNNVIRKFLILSNEYHCEINKDIQVHGCSYRSFLYFIPNVTKNPKTFGLRRVHPVYWCRRTL